MRGAHVGIRKELVMLVLSRKEGEAIVIDGQIEVTVLRLECGKVRIGITAPRAVRVVRGELERHDDAVHQK